MTKKLSIILALLATTLTSYSHAQEVKGDVESGKQKNAMCIGCHSIVGYQATFPQTYKVPMISGQSGKYIASALVAYQKGDRKHPTMRSIAASLTEQDIADLAAYYEQHGKTSAQLPATPERTPSVDAAALLAKGACVSCHGSNLSQPLDPSYPKIAGQYADYLFVALKSYKTENNPNVGRNNAIMGGIAKQFTNDELKALSNYVGSVQGDLKVVPQSRFR